MKKRRYSLLSSITVPFSLAPVSSFILSFFMIGRGVLAPIDILVRRRFIDGAIEAAKGNGDPRTVLPFLVVTLGIAFFVRLDSVPRWFAALGIWMAGRRKYARAILEKVARLQLRHIEDKATYDLIHRVSDEPESRIRDSLHNVTFLIDQVVHVVGVVIVVAAAGVWIVPVVTLLLLPISYFAIRSGKRAFVADQERSTATRLSDYYRDLSFRRESVAERRLFGMHPHILKKWREAHGESMRVFLKAEKANLITNGLAAKLPTYSLCVAVSIGLLFQLRSGVFSIGFFVAVITSLGGLYEAIAETIPSLIRRLSRDRLYWREVDLFFNLDEFGGDLSAPVAPRSFGEMRFENVHFRYPGTEREVLNGATFTISEGRQYAFVGENGCGKSTIIKLMLGLYEPQKGKITIDGRNVADLVAEELLGYFSVVFQDYARYQIKIKENITLGDSNQEAPDLLARVLAQGSVEDIEALPDGIDTLVGKAFGDGVDLSGGQWQKIAFCRGLYSRAPVRILDEPTAALDPIAESALYERYRDLFAGFTSVFVSHRLGSTRLADEIYLIHDGRVSERGSHDDLMIRQGRYAHMFELQRSWYQNEGE
jgi:ATP-binding cassette, subfamily B, bacterial